MSETFSGLSRNGALVFTSGASISTNTRVCTNTKKCNHKIQNNLMFFLAFASVFLRVCIDSFVLASQVKTRPKIQGHLARRNRN